MSEQRIALDNDVLILFLSDYLETSTSLASSAVVGILEYCRAIGSDSLAIDHSAPGREWWDIPSTEQVAMQDRAAALRMIALAQNPTDQ